MKIAFIGDQAGKVHNNRFDIFQKYIKEHSFYFIVADDPRLKKKCRKCDAVYYASCTLYLKYRVKHPLILGSATSWKCLIDKRSKKILDKLSVFKRVSANNLSLTNELKQYRHDIVYLPNGVETDFFCPSDFKFNPTRISIGWVGNKDRMEKNYRSILGPLRNQLRPHFNIRTIRSKKSDRASKMKSHSQMLKFYRDIAFYLVTSSHEGTPNPALEAAACGVPIISTRVGNMPELITHGVNGFFIKCNLRRVLRRINKLRRLSAEDYYPLRYNIRSEIEKNWSWEQAAKRFSEFFKF
jgi:glycosyltransferase involved in cell wall biosynthesis